MLMIFDCDGVLRSFSWQAVYKAYLAIARHINREPGDFWNSFEDFMGWIDFVDWFRSLERMGIPLGSDYTEIRKVFHAVYDPHIQVFPWANEVLSILSMRHRLAVLTSSTSASILPSIDRISGHFAHVITNDHVTNVKPDPEGIHLIMDKVGAKASQTLMIGDSHADILAGKNAGVKTAGVCWGMFGKEELVQHEPDYIFEDPYALTML